MKKFNYIHLFLISAALLLAPACGYHFEGGGYINDTITRVAVGLFDNQTTEAGADLTFSNALIQEIIEKSDTVVVDENQAPAVIRGVVKSIRFSTLSRSTTENVLERRISATLDVQILDDQGNVRWSVKNFTTHDEYTVSEDQVTDDANKAEAVEHIAQRSAEKIVSKLLSNF
jgi:outer membrane lipopolysaccharide assembly protein LptE/RlpB